MKVQFIIYKSNCLIQIAPPAVPIAPPLLEAPSPLPFIRVIP